MEKANFYFAVAIYNKRKEGITMPEEKKSRYTEAQARSAKKYLKETV